MRRVVIYPGRIAVEQAARPAPGPDEALVRTLLAGICGSDLHAAHGRHPFVPLPYRPGHEVVGIVESAAPAARACRPASGSSWSRTCPAGRARCAAPAARTCARTCSSSAAAIRRAAWRTTSPLPANRLHPVPDDLDDLTAALIEPLSTPVHAVRLAGDVAGRSVAVLGAGTIGLFTLAVLRAHGAGKVVSTDPLPAKRDRAAALGADVTVDATAPGAAGQVRKALGGSADIVFDCVSVQSSVDQAIAIADKGGTVVVVGVPAAGRHRPAAGPPGSPDPHPGQRHLPSRGLRGQRPACSAGEPSARPGLSRPCARWLRWPRLSRWPGREIT